MVIRSNGIHPSAILFPKYGLLKDPELNILMPKCQTQGLRTEVHKLISEVTETLSTYILQSIIMKCPQAISAVSIVWHFGFCIRSVKVKLMTHWSIRSRSLELKQLNVSNNHYFNYLNLCLSYN